MTALETGKDESQDGHTGSPSTHPHPLLCPDGVPRYRPDGSFKFAFRSIEHVLMSQSCETNRHLHRLTGGAGVPRLSPAVSSVMKTTSASSETKQEEWAKRFLNLLVLDERFANVACHKSKGLKKELIEGVSMIERVEQLLAKLEKQEDIDVDTQTGRGALLLDLGSGKGVAGVMLAIRFPQAKVIGLDIRPPSATERHLHEGVFPNFVRQTGNLYDDELLKDVITRETEKGGTCLLLVLLNACPIVSHYFGSCPCHVTGKHHTIANTVPMTVASALLSRSSLLATSIFFMSFLTIFLTFFRVFVIFFHYKKILTFV